MDFEDIRKLLWQFKDQFAAYGADLISFAMIIGGIGAILYIAVRVWGHIARAEPVDVYPLLRPFAIGLVIMSFPSFVGALDGVFKPLSDSTASIASANAAEAETKLNQFDEKWEKVWGLAGKADKKTQEEEEVRAEAVTVISVVKALMPGAASMQQLLNPIIAWLVEGFMKALRWIYSAISLFIETAAVFSLLIMSIFGPISFGLSIFDGLSNNMVTWISRYINLLLWTPIANVLKGLLCNIEIYAYDKALATLSTGTAESLSPWDMGGLIIFYVMGGLCFFLVPTLAGWIISGGGNSNAIGSRFSGFVSGVAGAAGTAAALATGVPAKIIAGSIAKSQTNSRSESETTRQG